MAIRDLLSPGRKVPVTKGANPIIAFQDEVNRLFSDFFGEMSLPGWPHMPGERTLALSPAVDVVENGKAFRITAELPGMESKDVELSAHDGYLTIRGEKKEESEEEKSGYYRKERSYGAFQRVLALPESANFEKAEAEFRNGVLTVSIPKKPGAESKEHKITVKSAA